MHDIILVVGDFMIDTAWVLSGVPAITAQVHGGVHDGKRIHPSWNDQQPGGAGVTCMALKSLSDQEKLGYEIHGLGLWNRRDDYRWTNLKVHIASLSSDRKKPDDSVFTLHHVEVENPNAIVTTLKNRYYNQLAEDFPRLGYRFDQDPDPNISPKFTDSPLPCSLPEPENIRAVVIMDFFKGAVNKNILDSLDDYLRNNEKCLWFVDSKSPDLHKVLYKLGIHALLLNRHEAEALTAVNLDTGDITPISIPNTKQPCLELIKVLERLQEIFQERAKWVIVKLDFQGAALYDCQHDNLFYAHRKTDYHATGIGAGDLFMAQTVLDCLTKPLIPDNSEIKRQIIRSACITASTWLRFSEREYWSKPEKSDIPSPLMLGEPTERIQKDEESQWDCEKYPFSAKKATLLSLFDYKKWVEDDKDCINIADAKGFLGDFISTDLQFRAKLLDFVSQIRDYVSFSSSARPLNCLVVAKPGMGKSFLANQIAKQTDCEIVEINVTRLISRKELLEAITLVQNIRRSTPLLFLDEIDGKIEGEAVYPLLLSPLWDAKVIVDGIARDLPKKMVTLLVASQAKSVETYFKQLRGDDVNKGRDFFSRLNGPSLTVEYSHKLPREYRSTNHVYLTAEMILRYHKNARAVEKELFDLVYDLDDYDPRKIEQLIASLPPPRDGIISLRDRNGKVLKILANLELEKVPLTECRSKLIYLRNSKMLEDD